MKPTKCPAREKTMRQEKRKKRKGEKEKSNLEIFLSAHARTSRADILHLDQKAAKCKSCNRLCGKFLLLIAPQ